MGVFLTNWRKFRGLGNFLDTFKETMTLILILHFFSASVATLKAQPIDYENADVFGNSITGKDNAYPHLNGVSGDYHEYNDVSKRVPEIFEGSSQKRNIISALRSKMRRSKVDVEDKLRFSPVLSVGESNLALQTTHKLYTEGFQLKTDIYHLL